jgi:hypothetical protein
LFQTDRLAAMLTLPMETKRDPGGKKKKNRTIAADTFTDTFLYLLSLALALSIHNKLLK